MRRWASVPGAARLVFRVKTKDFSMCYEKGKSQNFLIYSTLFLVSLILWFSVADILQGILSSLSFVMSEPMPVSASYIEKSKEIFLPNKTFQSYHNNQVSIKVLHKYAVNLLSYIFSIKRKLPSSICYCFTHDDECASVKVYRPVLSKVCLCGPPWPEKWCNIPQLVLNSHTRHYSYS